MELSQELTLHSSQKIVALDKHRFRVLRCGRRWGKTTLAIDQMKGQASIPNSRIAYVAPTYQQSRDIAWEQLKKDLKDAATFNEARLEIKLANGSIIVLRGWEAIETLRGQAFNLIVLDEVAMMRNFWLNWREVIRPTLTDTRGEAMFISTPKGFNHFYDLSNQELTDKDFKSYHFTSWDNPHLPKDELETAKATLPPDSFAQEYEASFQKTQGLVYKEFSREKHLYEELPVLWETNYQKIGGVDFGYRNPAAVLDIRFDGEKLFVEDEWYKRERTDIQIAEYVALCKFKSVYPDPESAGGIEELRRKNINVKEVIKGKGSIESGIQSIRELLLRGDLMINKRCVNLISEFEMYSYDESQGERNEKENPLKANDHACFTKDTKIEVLSGDILIQKSTGIKDIYEFMGSRVTKDHPYLTQRGFIPLDSIRYSDRIVIWKNKLLMELPLEDTQTPIGVSFGVILHLLQRNLRAIKQNAYIGMYGKNIMEKSLRAFISTIKTTTHLIIIYLISNVYHLMNTIKNTWRKSEGMELEILKLPALSLSNGINLAQERNFIDNSVNYLGRIKNSIKEIAIYVVKSTKHHSRLVQNSATIIAKLKHLGKEEVFATTTSSGYFVANGVVVSNCDALRYVVSSLLPMITRRDYIKSIPIYQHQPKNNPAR